MSQTAEVKIPDLSQNLSTLPKQAVMSDGVFKEIRKYIYDNAGIYFQDNKKYLLESRLQKRLNHLGLKSFEEYLKLIKSLLPNSPERRYFYDAITINETFFFRNQPQLEALSFQIFPELITKKIAIGKNKIRVWSAASSSGEEAYSVSMIFHDMIKPKFPNFEIEIIGTDISSSVVEVANQGVYKEYSVRNIPPYYFKKYFRIEGNTYHVVQEIKKNVSFKILNLYDDAMMKTMSNFDVIICANVLIYFDTNSKIKVVSNLYNALNKGGFLFIGYSETLQGISKAFSLVSFPKTVGYKKE